MADARDILRRVPIFAELTDDDCDVVLRVLRARRGRAGDTLFREGDRGDTLMIVVDGQLEATVTTSSGAQAKLSVIGPGQVVGELAFLDASPRAATIATSTGATVLEFSRQALLVLCRDRPKIAAAIQRNVLADLSRRVRDVEGTRGRPSMTSAAPASLRSDGGGARTSAVPGSARAKGRPVTAAQLRAVPALAKHAAEDLELLAYSSVLRGFAAGEALMHEGAAGDAAFLILNGSVVVTRGGQMGAVATLEAGALVGQLALLDRAPRSATVTASSDTTALELRAEVIQNLLKASSPLALRFQREIASAAARHLRAATAQFAASAAPQPEAGVGSEGIEGDWSNGEDEPIELGVDLDAIRH